MSEPQKETATTTTQAVAKKDKGEVEYTPFGAKDKIKLSISIVQRLVCVPTKSGKKCSDDDAIKFIAMCQAKHLNPFEGDCYMIGYDTQDGPQFSQITAHQVYLKRSEASKEYDGMQSGIIVREKDGTIKEIEGDFHLPDQVVLGGWARVFMKDRQHPTYRRVRLERFRKNTAIWRDDPAGMICKTAEADALRSTFPTLLGGLYMREEVEAGNQFAAPKFEDKGRVQSFLVAPDDIKVEQQPESAYNPVKAMRKLLQADRIPEETFVGFLANNGVIEEDIKTLEDIQERRPEVMALLAGEKYSEVKGQIQALMTPQSEPGQKKGE